MSVTHQATPRSSSSALAGRHDGSRHSMTAARPAGSASANASTSSPSYGSSSGTRNSTGPIRGPSPEARSTNTSTIGPAFRSRPTWVILALALSVNRNVSGVCLRQPSNRPAEGNRRNV